MRWTPQTLTPEQKQERRLYAGRLLQRGVAQAAVARQVGVSPAAVCKWAARLKGSSSLCLALANRAAAGRPARLTDAQWQHVLTILAQGALARGYDTDRWTLRRVADVIRDQFGVVYHHRSVGRGLRARGWSPQLPAPRANTRDEMVITTWLAHDWPRLKKMLADGAQRSSFWTRRGSDSTNGRGGRGRRQARLRS